MTAGLFASHGVFFGPSISANRYNPKGYFESVFMKRVFREGEPEKWPDPWFEFLRGEGYCPCDASWGVKTGAQRHALILAAGPTAVVFCRRPVRQIRRSRERVHWARATAEATVRAAEAALGRIRRRGGVPIFEVRTDRLVDGKFDEVEPVFDLLRPNFDPDIARKWIDPSLWSR